jgi:hypothetical protein
LGVVTGDSRIAETAGRAELAVFALLAERAVLAEWT